MDAMLAARESPQTQRAPNTQRRPQAQRPPHTQRRPHKQRRPQTQSPPQTQRRQQPQGPPQPQGLPQPRPAATPAAIAAGLAVGYLADRVLGDPARLHPVAGFGRLAERCESFVYAPTRRRGLLHAAGLVGPAGLTAELLARLAARLGNAVGVTAGRPATLAAFTWISLGGRSLSRVAATLSAQVRAGDLVAARATLPSLCGRDPQALDAAGLTRAAVESVAENTSDAVVGAILWAALAGPAGVAAYRAANTLDAMVGHRTDRYREFGWAAARLDDLLNWPAARLTVLLTALCAPLVGGSPVATWETVRRDGSSHPSPNAGRVEAAFAGALGVRLGGPLAYDGVLERRPTLGDGRAPTTADLDRATRLSSLVGTAAAVCCVAARTFVSAGLETRRRRPAAGSR
jgi:adenosylcobinamide-phosphate synthase